MQEIMEMQQKEVRKVQNLLEVPVGPCSFRHCLSHALDAESG
jgi:hypothetical protein